MNQFSVFDATHTRTHRETLTSARYCCYWRILNFHGKTCKLVAFLFFFYSFHLRRSSSSSEVVVVAVKFITEQTTRRLRLAAHAGAGAAVGVASLLLCCALGTGITSTGMTLLRHTRLPCHLSAHSNLIN